MLNFIPASVINWSLEHGIKIILLIFGAFIILKALKVFLKKAISHYVATAYHTRDGKAREKREATLEAVFLSSIKTVIYIIAILMILSEIGIDTAPLIAGAGIVGLAFGFGGQYLIRDLIAGFFIILEDQYRKGDVVKIADIGGMVEDINLRRTILRDLDGKEHHIPNGIIGTTTNMTKFWSRAHLNIGVAYKENVDYVFDVLNRLGREMAEDEKWKNDIIKPIQVVGVDDFADSAVIIKVLGDTKPIRQWDVMREYRRRVKNEFDKLGIEIPFPHRIIIQR
jgi:small conductance mechanosensitive channel